MKIPAMIGLTAAVALLAGCAEYGPGYVAGPGVAVTYDGYYDDAYGPFYDGYWGGDGVFYYRRGEHDHFHPDRAGHFRHEPRPGMHPVHGRPHGGGGHRDH
jgi:hypothetical protein